MTDNVTMTAIDGTDALAFVIIRPGSTDGGVSIEAAAKGLDKASAAYVLRHVANQWDGGQADHSATLSAANTLAERYEQMAANEETAIPHLQGPAAQYVEETVRERVRTYRKAAKDLREVLVTGRIPHDLMTDAELGD
jgi:hypothetical protein